LKEKNYIKKLRSTDEGKLADLQLPSATWAKVTTAKLNLLTETQLCELVTDRHPLVSLLPCPSCSWLGVCCCSQIRSPVWHPHY